MDILLRIYIYIFFWVLRRAFFVIEQDMDTDRDRDRDRDMEGDRDGKRDEDRGTDGMGIQIGTEHFCGVSDPGAQLLDPNISANLKPNSKKIRI
jgi:hypothetical protein